MDSLNIDLTYEESRALDNACYIDVRSPVEYAADHIPGALNWPLFDDEQREQLGTVYRQISQHEARFMGLDMAAARLPVLLRQLEELHKQGAKVVLYCWRGGLRSQAVATTAELMRIPCQRLTEGYRGYRQWVNERLEVPVRFPMVVLHGLTGCGKTAILRLLQEKYSLQTIDLEGLACHRGSVFGHIGLSEQPTQKYFQSQLTQMMAAYDNSLPLLTECESRRIGRLLLPEQFFAAMHNAKRLLIYDSAEGRLRRLLADYNPARHTELIAGALQSPPLRKKFGLERLRELNRQSQEGSYEQVVSFLLTHYYDPLYHYPSQPDAAYDACFSAADEEAAAQAVAEYISSLIPS